MMGKASVEVLFLLMISVVTQTNNAFYFPQTIPPVIANETSCPSAENIHLSIEQQMKALLLDPRPCNCGGPGWTRIAHLNMSDPDETCPAGWNLTDIPDVVRGCSRALSGPESCNSAFFPSDRAYSHVCGRITALQRNTPDAFGYNIDFENDIEGAYIDGVSLTHGAPGSRQHIWSFVAALAELFQFPFELCPCTRSDMDWPFEVPSFIEQKYFCATGNPEPTFSYTDIYPDDPLWDGRGCGLNNTCCEFNNPPWFCTSLPQPTTDSLEVRICLDQDSNDEDIIVTFIDIYTM